MTTAVFRRLEEALAGVAKRGVVHVGAHRGQEVTDYRRCGFDVIRLVEPNPTLWPSLDRLGVDVHHCAAGPAGTATLHITDWDERSSLLRPVDYAVARSITVPVRPLSEMQDGCNVAVLDCQGFELDVLITADLDRLDAVIVEACDHVRYQGAATRQIITDWFHQRGWRQSGSYGGHSTPDHVDLVWRPPCES